MFCLKSTLDRVGDELAQIKMQNEALREENAILSTIVESSEEHVSKLTNHVLSQSSDNLGKIYAVEGDIEQRIQSTNNPEIAAELKRLLNFVKTL